MSVGVCVHVYSYVKVLVCVNYGQKIGLLL